MTPSPSLRTIVHPAVPAADVPSGKALRTEYVADPDAEVATQEQSPDQSTHSTQYVPWATSAVPAWSTQPSCIGGGVEAVSSTDRSAPSDNSNSLPAQPYPHVPLPAVIHGTTCAQRDSACDAPPVAAAAPPAQHPQATLPSADASRASPVSYAPSVTLGAEHRHSAHAVPHAAAAATSAPAEAQRPRAATAPAGSTQHTFMRQVTKDGSAAQTVLTNPDGSQRVFGETTVESLVTSTEASVERWIGSLGDFEMRALIHEMGQRLVQGSKKYHANKEMLEEASKQQDLSLFGLDEGAGDEELDKAYRRKAREMHPDKNGGTDEAKEAFQEMRTRYDNLKNRRRSSSGVEPQRPDGDEAGAPREPERTPDPEEEEGRPVLERSAWKMIGQLKAIRHSESIVRAKFESVRPKAASA